MPPFEYKPRSKCSWLIRAGQQADSVLVPAKVSIREPEPPARAPEKELSEQEEFSKSSVVPKITMGTLCVCGHPRGDHHTDPKFHWPMEDGAFGQFTCITEHCTCGIRVIGENRHEPCPCLYFFAPGVEKAPVFKRPSADDYSPCLNCGHWKNHHCKVRKPSKTKTKPWESPAWTGFEINGVPYQCRHTAPDASPYRCTSTSCSFSADGEHFCECPKFVSPYSRPRTKPVGKATAKLRASKKRGNAGNEEQSGLFPQADIAMDGAEAGR
jgi:hypothetical protein